MQEYRIFNEFCNCYPCMKIMMFSCFQREKKSSWNCPMLTPVLINLESRYIIIFRGICLFYLCIWKWWKDSKEIRERKSVMKNVEGCDINRFHKHAFWKIRQKWVENKWISLSGKTFKILSSGSHLLPGSNNLLLSDC